MGALRSAPVVARFRLRSQNRVRRVPGARLLLCPRVRCHQRRRGLHPSDLPALNVNPIREALNQAGVNAAALDRIRLARGVVGKTSYVAGAAILVIGGIAWRLPDHLLIAAGLVAVVFVLYFLGVLWFANRHPGVALLEGAELIQWRQLDMIAKSGVPIANVPVPYEADSKDSRTK